MLVNMLAPYHWRNIGCSGLRPQVRRSYMYKAIYVYMYIYIYESIHSCMDLGIHIYVGEDVSALPLAQHEVLRAEAADAENIYT